MTAQPRGTDERRIRVLWNPTAGHKGGLPTNHSSRAMLLELLSRHGLGDELVEPGSEQEAVEAARDAVDRGYDTVVAAGGDGTFGLVGRQLIGTRTALGILPLGSVMNIPRMLGLPRDPEEAAHILAVGHVRTIDVGQVGDRIFYEARLGRAACRRDAGAAPGGQGRLWGDRSVGRGRVSLSTVRSAHRAGRRPHIRREGGRRRCREWALHGPRGRRCTRGLARRWPVRRARVSALHED